VTDGVQIGEEAPVFNAVSLSGASVSSADYVGRPTAILFVSPTCPSCTTTLHEMEALHYKTGGSVIVICRASRDDCVHLAERYEITAPMVADEDERISQLFGITIVPTAILIDADNRIQTYGHPMRGEEMEAMFEAEPAAEIPGGG